MDPPVTCEPTGLEQRAWYGTNRETVLGWLDQHGCASAGFDVDRPPIAVFDWDNTVLKNDVGDAITFYMIANDKVLQPPNQDWTQVSRYMTPEGAAALGAACGTTVPAGMPLPTSTDADCANEMLSMYIDNLTTGGAVGFAGHNYRRMEPTYAFTAQILAGYTPAEIEAFTLAAIAPMLAAPIGATQVVGTRTLNGYLRVYDEIRELIAAAQSRRYDVWVITASPQPVVRAFAPMAGIAPDHVVGIRQLLDGQGRLTYDIEGCGTVADGDNSMISYIEGKRCWVNKVIYGDTGPTAMLSRPAGERAIFGAGDSDTDIEFLRDAKYRLVLNRGKREVMCYAYHHDGDANSWVVNPMFIAPRPEGSAYPCSTTACKNVYGVGGPCLDDFRDIIPDQLDTVFAP